MTLVIDKVHLGEKPFNCPQKNLLTFSEAIVCMSFSLFLCIKENNSWYDFRPAVMIEWDTARTEILLILLKKN